MCLWATMRERQRRYAYVRRMPRSLLIRVPIVLHSFFLFLFSLFLSPLHFFPLCSRTCIAPLPACVLRHDDTRERILTDWKPFTTDATSSSSSSSNVSPFCIPQAFRWWIHPRRISRRRWFDFATIVRIDPCVPCCANYVQSYVRYKRKREMNRSDLYSFEQSRHNWLSTFKRGLRDAFFLVN